MNDSDKARMRKYEGIEMYVHRLESLAQKKFGDDGISENKELMKFLETVPPSVAEYVNERRKEKMRWVGERLLWDDEQNGKQKKEKERNREPVKSKAGRTSEVSGVFQIHSRTRRKTRTRAP